MKQVQHLPPGVSQPKTVLLSGFLPIKGTLHERILTTVCSMFRYINTAEYKLIKRQLALNDDNVMSWVVIVKKLLHQYYLPSVVDLILEPPSKET